MRVADKKKKTLLYIARKRPLYKTETFLINAKFDYWVANYLQARNMCPPSVALTARLN